MSDGIYFGNFGHKSFGTGRLLRTVVLFKEHTRLKRKKFATLSNECFLNISSLIWQRTMKKFEHHTFICAATRILSRLSLGSKNAKFLSNFNNYRFQQCFASIVFKPSLFKLKLKPNHFRLLN